jgi:HPt (histidine-containing phosphotransfer) domain-containing protein
MTVPTPLIEFFQQEAAEYLERLDQLLATADQGTPDAASFVAQARALRGSAMMTRLDGLTELAATVERIATGLRSGGLQWDQRLLFAVRGALAELRVLVSLASRWGENEQRRSRTQSVALAAVAAGYMAGGSLPNVPPASAVVPISRLLLDDGNPPVVYRNPSPAVGITQRFRADIAAAADGVAREISTMLSTAPGGAQLAAADGVRRALLGVSDVADSYGATSISTLATRMARSGLEQSSSRISVQSFARLLMDRELRDKELAMQVRSAAAAWNAAHGTPSLSATPARTIEPSVEAPAAAPAAVAPAAAPSDASIVYIDTLLFRGQAAIAETQRVRDRLRAAVSRQDVTIGELSELVDELSDLIDLAATA